MLTIKWILATVDDITWSQFQMIIMKIGIHRLYLARKYVPWASRWYRMLLPGGNVLSNHIFINIRQHEFCIYDKVSYDWRDQPFRCDLSWSYFVESIAIFIGTTWWIIDDITVNTRKQYLRYYLKLTFSQFEYEANLHIESIKNKRKKSKQNHYI